MLYRIFSALCLLAFYGIYFRKMYLQHKKGIVADCLGKGDKDKKTVNTELLAKAVSSCAVVAEVVSVFTSKGTAFPELRIAGGFCSLAGIGFLYAAVNNLGDSWRAGIPSGEETRLVTTGIYRLSRNPAFLGFDLMHLGILFMFFNILLAGFVIFAMVMLHLLILQEEVFLEERFGEKYLRYKEKTGRYFSS